MNTITPSSSPRALMTTILGGLVGFLIAIPLGALVEGVAATLGLILFTAAGARIGYRQRESTLFFYLALFVAVILITLVTKQGLIVR